MRHGARLTSESLVGRDAVRTRTGACVLAIVVSFCGVASRGQGSPEAKGLRTVGVVKSIGNGTITVAADSGEEVSASLQSDTKILRVAPGEKDLKSATPLQVEDVKVGDRVLVRGLPMAGGQTVKAVAVILMKQEDVASKQEREREDWQRRGVGGLVTAVDAAAGTITVSMGASGPGAPAKMLTVRTSKDTILRRYAANSIKFDDAKPGPIGNIRPGDQLRARGTKNADGSEIAADEVISGSFRNIAGTILAKDEGATTITVQDAITKKQVTVKLGGDSTLKVLPPEMAQRIAMRLKGGAGGAGVPGGGGQGGASSGGSAAGGAPGSGARPPGGWSSGGAGGPGAGPGGAGGGPPDLQRFLSRLPNKGLADLTKGDAVMIVATEGGDGKPVMAITLLAGVEPILTAAPNGGSTLSSWTLGSSMGEGGPQ